MSRKLMIWTAALAAGLLFSQTQPSAPVRSSEYWMTPHSDYESRRQQFVEYSAAAAGPNALYAQVARLAAGRAVDERPIRSALEFINARNDTSDFRVTALVRIYQEAKPNLVSDALLQDIRKTLLGFKYWPDEPGNNDLLSMRRNLCTAEHC